MQTFEMTDDRIADVAKKSGIAHGKLKNIREKAGLNGQAVYVRVDRDFCQYVLIARAQRMSMRMLNDLLDDLDMWMSESHQLVGDRDRRE